MLKDCWNQFLSGKKKSKNFNLIFSFEFHSRTLLLVASSYLKGRYRHRLTDNHLSLESEGEPPWWFCSFNLIIRKSYMVFAVSLLHTCMYKSKNTAIFPWNRSLGNESIDLRSILQFFVKSLIKHVYRIKELQLQFFRENNDVQSDNFFSFFREIDVWIIFLWIQLFHEWCRFTKNCPQIKEKM